MVFELTGKNSTPIKVSIDNRSRCYSFSVIIWYLDLILEIKHRFFKLILLIWIWTKSHFLTFLLRAVTRPNLSNFFYLAFNYFNFIKHDRKVSCIVKIITQHTQWFKYYTFILLYTMFSLLQTATPHHFEFWRIFFSYSLSYTRGTVEVASILGGSEMKMFR